MRVKRVHYKISVPEETYRRLQLDRQEFQRTIGGGKWSLADTILEYLKILDAMQNGKKP